MNTRATAVLNVFNSIYEPVIDDNGKWVVHYKMGNEWWSEFFVDESKAKSFYKRKVQELETLFGIAEKSGKPR